MRTTLQSHTFASHTSQSLQKSVPVPTQEEFQNIFSTPYKKIKTPDTHSDTTKTLKRSADNGLQGRPRKTPAGNSTYPKGGFSCSKDSFLVNQTLVFQIKFCGKSPALRVAAKRYGQG